MKKKIVSIIIAAFTMALAFNAVSCTGKRLEAERNANEAAGFGRLTNEEVENERTQNDAAGYGRITNAELTVKLDAERAANEEAGLGKLTNAEVNEERERNEEAGLGKLTNAEIDAMRLKPEDVPEGYVLEDVGETFLMENMYLDWPDGNPKSKSEDKMVSVSPLIIGKTEVTQKLYESVMGKNPSYHKGPNKPVERVSWNDAIKFCNALSESDGLVPCYSKDSSGNWTWDKNTNGWRLPTEAEWKYAARGGSKSKDYWYSGSNEFNDVSWEYNNSDWKTHDVAKKAPNELGLYDMSGNVGEWTWNRICCGGSFNSGDLYEESDSICWKGYEEKAWETSNELGFRIVRSAPVSIAPKKIMTVGENLKLRSGEATSSKVLAVMQAGARLRILELGKAETIDGISSNWVKVEVQADAKDVDGKSIEQGLVGWCYGGYLF